MENASVEFFEFFSGNQMKSKFHFISSESKGFVINVENNQIINNKCDKLLGIKIDHKLAFNAHIVAISKTAGQKMNVLSRVIQYMNIAKRRTLLNGFFTSQFNYHRDVPQSCKNNKINRLHEACFRIIYNDKVLLSNY